MYLRRWVTKGLILPNIIFGKKMVVCSIRFIQNIKHKTPYATSLLVRASLVSERWRDTPGRWKFAFEIINLPPFPLSYMNT